jgi:hypothetical protein
MGSSGLSAMISAGAALEHELDMVVISIGRPAVGDEDYEMQIYGSWIAFRITLRASGGRPDGQRGGRVGFIAARRGRRPRVGDRPTPCREHRAQRGPFAYEAD